ncbi:hypothetical protein [Rhizobium leguminosarum]|uniref:hypothetical protein n=1 Tax=Rhizobium leguminosarum TaxID=384 RepID=UPI001C951B89|nr:hypothetical protein [Rhizobium leguminosarum]
MDEELDAVLLAKAREALNGGPPGPLSERRERRLSIAIRFLKQIHLRGLPRVSTI